MVNNSQTNIHVCRPLTTFEDQKLAQNAPTGLIDLIVGGHDHFYAHHFINGTHVLRSGTDFKQLSYITARRRPEVKDNEPRWDFDIVRRDVVRDIPEDPETVTLISDLGSSLKSKLGTAVHHYHDVVLKVFRETCRIYCHSSRRSVHYRSYL